MADGIYVGMAAAEARTIQLDSIADNLANAQTPGFKAERPAFHSFLHKQGNDKIMAAAVETGVDRTPGVIVTTERPLDVVPPSDTFLAVGTPAGTIAYTRNGNIEIGDQGQLTVAGHPLLDDNAQPLSVPPGTRPTISEDGTLLIDNVASARLGLARIDGPLTRQGATLIMPGTGATVAPATDTRLHVGALEMGNAPPLEATLQMIGAQRHFETAMQAIQTYRRMDEKATDVGKVR